MRANTQTKRGRKPMENNCLWDIKRPIDWEKINAIRYQLHEADKLLFEHKGKMPLYLYRKLSHCISFAKASLSEI